MTFADDNPQLFSQGELRDALESYKLQLVSAVDELPEDQLLSTSEQTLRDHFVSKFTRTPLEVYEDHIEADKAESLVDVSHDRDRAWGRSGAGPLMVKSLKLTLHIPYAGPIGLWDLRPNPWKDSFSRGKVNGQSGGMNGELLLTINLPSDEGSEKFERIKSNALEEIRFNISSQREQLVSFNSRLLDMVQQAISGRRKKLQAHDDVLSVLNIPLRQKQDAPSFTPIRVDKVLVPLPPAAKKGQKPEPGISEETYEHIINIIRHEGRAWETSPNTYAVHDEEELRDIILSHLKTHFVAAATGETFRKLGKTDIHISEDDRAAFVAECKIWTGPSDLSAALDQMFGYLTWRDCKAALVIFNKTVVGFKNILEKIPTALESHAKYLRTVETGSDDEAEHRFVFRSADDEERKVIVHVFAFNLYVNSGK